jgi:N-ethylmaleimide reductase
MVADTFLPDGTNRRTDIYGGSLENRVRFTVEVLEAMISVWGQTCGDSCISKP